MLRRLLMVIIFVANIYSSMVFAYNRNMRGNGQAQLENQYVIYKWYNKGIASYSQNPPYGIKSYVMLNKQGNQLKKDKPYSDGSDGNVIRAIRPVSDKKVDVQPSNTENNSQKDVNKELPPGTITISQRCDTLRKNSDIIKNKKTVYEDDGQGNLVPLTDKEVEQKQLEIQNQIEQLCKKT